MSIFFFLKLNSELVKYKKECKDCGRAFSMPYTGCSSFVYFVQIITYRDYPARRRSLPGVLGVFAFGEPPKSELSNWCADDKHAGIGRKKYMAAVFA